MHVLFKAKLIAYFQKRVHASALRMFDIKIHEKVDEKVVRFIQ